MQTRTSASRVHLQTVLFACLFSLLTSKAKEKFSRGSNTSATLKFGTMKICNQLTKGSSRRKISMNWLLNSPIYHRWRYANFVYNDGILAFILLHKNRFQCARIRPFVLSKQRCIALMQRIANNADPYSRSTVPDEQPPNRPAAIDPIKRHLDNLKDIHRRFAEKNACDSDNFPSKTHHVSKLKWARLAVLNYWFLCLSACSIKTCRHWFYLHFFIWKIQILWLSDSKYKPGF